MRHITGTRSMGIGRAPYEPISGDIKKMVETKTKLTDTTKKLFSTGFFHIFGGNMVNKIIGFLSSVVLIRILTKSNYGTFTYAWNIYSLVVLFSGMGMEAASIQLSGEKGGEVEYTKSIFVYAIRFGLRFNILLSMLLLMIGLFAPLKIPEGGRLLCALCLLPLFQFVFGMTSCYLRSQKRNQDYSKLSVTNSLMVFAFSACGALVFREMGMIIGQYASAIISCFIGVLAFRVRILSCSPVKKINDKKDLLKIGFISVLINSLSQLLYLLDIFVIGILDPQETVLASYKVATIIPSALVFIPLSLMVYLYPYFAEHKDDGEWCIRNYKKLLMGIGSFNLLISMTLFLGAPYIVGIIFGKEYLDAVAIFKILSLNYFISGTFRIISGNLLVTQRKLRFNLIETIISSLINIIADYFLIQRFGSMGAALATVLVVLVSSTMSTLYLMITFNKKRKKS